MPNLAQVPDIHVICGTLKEFLRSLKEPLITHIRWDEFARAANLSDPQDRKIALKRIINDLPQPNRDTLAYMMLHLQRVAKVPDCKMPASNLAKVFGPTLIGYSQTEPENVYAETNTGNKVCCRCRKYLISTVGLFCFFKAENVREKRFHCFYNSLFSDNK